MVCRELASDSSLAVKHAPLYHLMQASLSLLAPPSASIPQDLEAAQSRTGPLLQDIQTSQKYGPLAALLKGRRPETVVGALCALVALVQPAVVSA